MLNDLSEILQIESVLSDSKENAPFGANLRKTLDWFLHKAKSYGLEVGEYDGYCGYAEYNGGNDKHNKPKDLIGILCHLDVVPAGEGWTYPPYALTNKDGILYGRGVVDNKGSAVVALHILKALKENNIRLNNRIRIIVGCNEETGSACLKHYVKKGEIPKMSFVPDSDFPIINSEKGIMNLDITIPADEFIKQNILLFNSGERPNVVPDRAKIEIKSNSPLAKILDNLGGGKLDDNIFCCEKLANAIKATGAKISDFSIKKSDDKIVIQTYGIAGHGMAPHKADNAIFKIFAVLTALSSDSGGETVNLINNLFCSPLPTERLGIACSDDNSGDLTVSLGMIKYAENSLTLTFNIRLPICANKDTVIEKIMSQLPKNSKFAITHFAPNLYIDKDSPLIKTLLKVYTDVTKNEPYVVKTGGGTYARELPNAIAFGPMFPGTQPNIHNIDEHISIKEFEMLYDIYYNAVIELDKI